MSFSSWFRSAPQREERSVGEQLAEERALRAEVERDSLRQQLADAKDRITILDAKHDALLAQVLGRDASITYPVTNPAAKSAKTVLERAISGMNTSTFSRAPKSSSAVQE